MIGKCFVMAVTLGLWTMPAQAESVRAQDPGSVMRALQGAGYSAELKTDTEGDPMIASEVSGAKFLIFFYNCTNHKDCATVQFWAGFHGDKPVTQEQLNDWNRRERFGRAFLDKDGDPNLAMDVDLDDGGVPALLFIDNIEFWESSLAKFQKQVVFPDD